MIEVTSGSDSPHSRSAARQVGLRLAITRQPQEGELRHTEKHNTAPGNFAGWHPASPLGERAIFLFAFICLIAGIAIGYMLRGRMTPEVAAPAAQSATPPPASSETPLPPLEVAVGPVEAALKANPNNAKLLSKLGNIYYDHHVYSRATAYYERALQIDPRDVRVRTDLGTAYVYSGLPRQAVAEYQQALAIDPRHFQTLFNLGVVYETGLRDPAHAVAAWQKLLDLYPQNPERDRIEKLIQSARREQATSKTAR